MQRKKLVAAGVVAVGAVATTIMLVGPSAVAAGSPAVVQSPLDGTVTSAAGEHHTVFYDPAAGAVGDVAMDVGAGEGTAVFPRIGYDGEGGLTLEIAEVLESCSSGDGGQAVRVNVTTDGFTVGSVTYAHLAAVSVAAGDQVGSDTALGEVAGGLPVDEACWTGPHVHVEWVNHADYACYIPRETGTGLAAGDSVGQVGGDFGDGQGIVCP